jgi:hypothetical protein
MPSPEAFVSVHKNTVGIGPGLCRILLHWGFIAVGYDDGQRVRDEDEY